MLGCWSLGWRWPSPPDAPGHVGEFGRGEAVPRRALPYRRRGTEPRHYTRPTAHAAASMHERGTQ